MEMERKFTMIAGAFDQQIKSLKDNLISQDKMYARSNQIKFNAYEKRISDLEQIFHEEITTWKANNANREIAAAAEAHTKMEGLNESMADERHPG